MLTDIPTDLTGIPLQYQVYITWVIMGAKYLAEFYSSVKAGGGMKRIIMAFWFGEQLPKVVAQDYRKEIEGNKQ